MLVRTLLLVCLLYCVFSSSVRAEDVTREQAEQALQQAIRFYSTQCSKHGGYVWRYSLDLKLSEGEAETDADTIWVQPYGTPSVGLAFLEAYRATQKSAYLETAEQAASALLAGQMQSGGWYYSIAFAPEERRKWGYRDNERFRLDPSRKNKTNITTLDDDTTPAAVRFLIELDRELKFENRKLHTAVEFSLDALLKAQHPSGGWSQNWDRHPDQKEGPDFPILAASYPKSWPREWDNQWTGKYYLNDNVQGNMVATMLLAWKTYSETRYLNSAIAGGEFLIRAQMPDKQRGWAQQYDEKMHPVWDRKFEPPAVSSDETQEAIVTLIELYDATGESRFLEPIPDALDWLKRSELPEGNLARFYELETNKPLYFVVVGKVYQLTYDDKNLPTHYGFKIDSKVEGLSKLLEKAQAGKRNLFVRSRPSSGKVSGIIANLDERGAWVEEGNMKGFNKASREGVIESETFVKNVQTLAEYLKP
ncbi:MAG: hypothetical protein KDA78_08725 [Planctomycetaceae bacterium]|nr:hypothetical protein [Planctomycetaceae bacterium]